MSINLKLHSHELSTSFISVDASDDGQLSGQIKVKLLDLKDALTMDVDNNGELTWNEIESVKPNIIDYIHQRLRFSRNQVDCNMQLSQKMMLQQTDATYLLIPMQATCALNGSLEVKYEMLFDILANHKAIVSVKDGANDYLSVITNSDDTSSFSIASTGMWHTFVTFVYQGIFHILIGYDHILFLLTLLLTVSFYRDNGKWKAIKSKTSIIKRTLWIVTSFTIAHSITLSGTALGIVPQFGTWVEVIIAASILFNVLNNVYPIVRHLTIITFVFGLIHGMGFAGALTELGIPSTQKTLAVLAFNIGVELGQLLLILAILPVLIAIRDFDLYRRKILPFLSSIIGVLAMYWMISRI